MPVLPSDTLIQATHGTLKSDFKAAALEAALGVSQYLARVDHVHPPGYSNAIVYGTTAERPSSPSTGAIRYNSTLAQVELWNGSSWVAVGSGSSGTGYPIELGYSRF